jgi:hypothetical protein
VRGCFFFFFENNLKDDRVNDQRTSFLLKETFSIVIVLKERWLLIHCNDTTIFLEKCVHISHLSYIVGCLQ